MGDQGPVGTSMNPCRRSGALDEGERVSDEEGPTLLLVSGDVTRWRHGPGPGSRTVRE